MSVVVLAGLVGLTEEQHIELRALTNSPEVAATVATRARIVLWHNEGRRKKDVAALAGVSRPTVDLWLGRYTTEGVAPNRIFDVEWRNAYYPGNATPNLNYEVRLFEGQSSFDVVYGLVTDLTRRGVLAAVKAI